MDCHTPTPKNKAKKEKKNAFTILSPIQFNSLGTIADICHVMSLLAMSLGLRFCFSRKSGAGGGGWVHLKCENSMPHLGSPLEMT